MNESETSSSPAVEVFATMEELARRAAGSLFRIVARARTEERRACVALSGGATPRPLFRLLAAEYGDRIDWPRLEIFFGDERGVPPDHPDSNYRAARDELFDRVGVPAGRIHRIEAEREDPGAAARDYERTMREIVPVGEDGSPRFDLIWLGLGEDGHVASLFPGTPALEEREAWVVANRAPGAEAWRVTITYPVIVSASLVQLLVAGPGKAEVVRRVLQPAPGEAPDELPAGRLSILGGRAEWLLDREAAGALTG